MTDTNGTVSTKLNETRERRKLLREEIAIKKLEQTKKLLESWWQFDGFGGSDLWDRFRPSTNDGSEGWYPIVPPNVPSDRKHGENWPIYRNQFELDLLRQESRMRTASNSFAIGLLNNLTNNVIGKGMTIQVKPKLPKGVEPTAGQKKEAEFVQNYLDEWRKRNNWAGEVDPETLVISGSMQREIYRGVKVDGEWFLRFYEGDDFDVSVINTEQIRGPVNKDGTTRDGWTFGIQHQMHPYENIKKPEAYSVYWPDPTATGGREGKEGIYEEVDAKEVLHIKGPDTPSNVKRGLPLFIFDTGKALDRAAKLQMFTSVGATVQASNAEIWQMANQTQTQVSSMAQTLGAYTRNNPVSGKTETYDRARPGTTRRVPEGMQSIGLPPSNAPSFLQTVQGDIQQASASSCSPAFWLGDTANANYSNLESASAPPVRAGVCEQEYFKAVEAAVMWRVLLFGERKGKLPDGITKRIDLHVEAPAVLHRNELEKANEDNILIPLGVKDRETAAAERGLDFDKVVANNLEYQEMTGGMGQQLPDDTEDDQGKGGAAAKQKKFPGQPVRESKDASGHEHDAIGRFGTGGASGKPAKDRAKQNAEEEAADIVAFQNKVHSGNHYSLERPDTPVFNSEHRKQVEQSVYSSINEATDGKAGVAPYYLGKTGWTQIVISHRGDEKQSVTIGSLDGSIPADGRIEIFGSPPWDQSDNGHGVTVYPDDSPEWQQKKIRYALSLKLSAEDKSAVRANRNGKEVKV